MADEQYQTWMQRAAYVAGGVVVGLVIGIKGCNYQPKVVVSVDGKPVAGLEEIARVGSQDVTVKQTPKDKNGNYAVAIDAYRKAPAASATATGTPSGKKGGKSGKGKSAKPTVTAGDDDLPDAVPEGQAPPQ